MRKMKTDKIFSKKKIDKMLQTESETRFGGRKRKIEVNIEMLILIVAYLSFYHADHFER